MGLSFSYEFTAPAYTSASELEAFLCDVEHEAQALGFRPTIVLNVPFDSPERREFTNRLGGNFPLQDEGLKGVAMPAPGQLRNHDPESGECRLFPDRAVVLVATDERGCESCFGFFKFRTMSSIITARLSRTPVFKTGGSFAISWIHLIARYGAIVGRFKERGFGRSVKGNFTGIGVQMKTLPRKEESAQQRRVSLFS